MVPIEKILFEEIRSYITLILRNIGISNGRTKKGKSKSPKTGLIMIVNCIVDQLTNDLSFLPDHQTPGQMSSGQQLVKEYFPGTTLLLLLKSHLELLKLPMKRV